MPGGLAGHVGHDPPQRVPVAVDRDGEARVRVADGTDRAVAVLDRRPVAPQHIGCGTVGGDGHVVLPVRVPAAPMRWWPNQYRSASARVLDQPQDGGATVDQDAAQLPVGHPSAFFSTQCRANDSYTCRRCMAHRADPCSSHELDQAGLVKAKGDAD